MKIKLRIFGVASYIIGIILVLFTIGMYTNFVDPYNLLVKESFIVTIYHCITVISILTLLVMSFFVFRKADYPETTKNTGFVMFTSFVLGFLFATYFVSSIITHIRINTIQSGLLSSTLLSQDTIIRFLYTAGVILALPCAVYFISIAVRKNFDRTPSLCFLSLFPLIWFAIRLIYIFMQNSSSVNAAGRKLDIITLCLCVFFFLAQSKLTLPVTEKASEKRSFRIFLATGYCAITTLIISQISKVLLQTFWLLTPSDTYIVNAIYITLFLYITSRIFSVSKSIQ